MIDSGHSHYPKSRHVPRPAALVLSLDFELAWGVRHTRGAAGYQENLVGAREAVPRILDLLAAFRVGATWATVGLLFAESREEARACAPSLRPRYHEDTLSPYGDVEGVGANEAADPLHLAPGLIETIRRTPHQEIGTHTYSHFFCHEPGSSGEAFRADLESAVAIARDRGIEIHSLVFPRDQWRPEYANTLVDLGITSFRGNQRGWMYPAARAAVQDAPLRRLGRWADAHAPLERGNLVSWDSVLRPDGLCNVRGSRFLRPYSRGRPLLEALRLRRITGEMENAARNGSIYHLWFHPHNFGRDLRPNLEFLTRVLERFDCCRTKYGMRSMTMCEVAVQVRR